MQEAVATNGGLKGEVKLLERLARGNLAALMRAWPPWLSRLSVSVFSNTAAVRRTANRRAHATLVRMVEGDGPAADDAVLDLRELLEATQQRSGVGGPRGGGSACRCRAAHDLRADQLGTARQVLDLFEALAVGLCALALALYALAVFRAPGQRRDTVRACGAGLVAAGAAVLVGRALAGDAVVHALTTTNTVRPAADATWTIARSLLAEIAGTAVVCGVVVVAATWLAEPTRGAVAARRALAPSLREAWVAYGAVAVLVLLLLA